MRLFFALGFLCTAGTLCGQNLLDNASFEKADPSRLAAWEWHSGAARATCEPDTAEARSGTASLCLKNPSPQSPNVFGCLTQTVRVRPNQRYTLSCYVKTADGGVAWMGGGIQWQHRFLFPKKTEGWQRVVGSFTTAAGESQFTVRIHTDSATAGLWIDDVMLEPGGEATAFLYEPPLAAGEVRLRLSPFDPGENLLPNASFEQADGAKPQGWLWDPRNTDATLTLDAQSPRSGRAALRLSNGTAFGAHVYGTLWLAREVRVKPGTSYTLSAFVKTGDTPPGIWLGGGEGWKVRRSFPATRGRWERVSITFVPGENETAFLPRIVTDRPVAAAWVDDVSLREGVRAVPGALEGAAIGDFVDLQPAAAPEVLHQGQPVIPRWAPQRWPLDTWAFCGTEFRAEGLATRADPSAPAQLDVALLDAAGNPVARQTQPLAAGTRAAFIELRAELGGQSPERLRLEARLLRDGQPLAAHAGEINLVTAARVRTLLARIAEPRDRLRASVDRLERRGLGAASRVTLTVLDNFLPWVEEDLANGKIDRAWDTARLLEQMAVREAAHAGAILAGQASDVPVPRYATGKLEVSRGQTLGLRRAPDGTAERGPVFFTGYGHFGQVKRDIEKLPGYGCNLFQVEFGPSSVLPREGVTSDRAIEEFLALCDRAAAADVAVNLLLSPHYFPEWALEKWPHLKTCHGGFFKYCVHDPDARAVIQASLRHVIPRIKDHPALHSLCLSNEPVCEDRRHCRVAATAWPAWLERRHGTIAALNARWGTAYPDFASVPIPAPEFTATPACLDFIRFNQETFAEFHQWMADVVHSMAPGLPVHAKIMMGAHFQKTLHGFWSVDPERFAAVGAYNGNDAYNMFDKEGSRWNNGWRHCQAGYDFQRSMADKPVFNSENHVIADRDLGAIPPEHIDETLWQNAIHGQSSTTLWLWERNHDDVGDAAGSILHRPDCVEAVGRCALDLNRLAREVAALQNLPPAVCLLWSESSMVLGNDHEHLLMQAYEAANFLGLPLGFATEAKLAEAARGAALPRPLDTARVLILPQVTHLPDAARAGLAKLQAAGVRVVAYGARPERGDDGQARPCEGLEALPAAPDSETLFARLTERSAAWGLPRAVQLLDDAGKPVFGVEVRSVSDAAGTVVAVCNHLREARTGTLSGLRGRPHVELRSGKTFDAAFTAEPMKPLLIRVAP